MDSIAVVGCWIGIAFVCYALAEKKGKSRWMGLLFGIFALIYYLCSKGSKDYQLQKAQEKIKELGK